MNKELFANENILGLKDPSRPFPTGQTGGSEGVGLLKWRMQSTDESMVPLTSRFTTIVHWSTICICIHALITYNACCSQLLALFFWKRYLCQHRV